MSADKHTAEVIGNTVRFHVRPDTVIPFYAYELVILSIPAFFAVIFGLFHGNGDNMSITLSLLIGVAIAVGVIFILPSNRYRRAYSFIISDDAVRLDQKGGTPLVLPLTSLREIGLRNTMIGKWHHNMVLAGQGPTNTAYVGVGLGGMAAAQGMAVAEGAAAASRRFFYAISAGPRSRRSFYVVLRNSNGETVIGGGLTEQAAIDLSDDVGRAIAQLT